MVRIVRQRTAVPVLMQLGVNRDNRASIGYAVRTSVKSIMWSMRYVGPAEMYLFDELYVKIACNVRVDIMGGLDVLLVYNRSTRKHEGADRPPHRELHVAADILLIVMAHLLLQRLGGFRQDSPDLRLRYRRNITMTADAF